MHLRMSKIADLIMASCSDVLQYAFDVSLGDDFQSFFLYAGCMLLSVSIQKTFEIKTSEALQHFEPRPSVQEQLNPDSNDNLLGTDVEAFTEIPQPVHSTEAVLSVESMPTTSQSASNSKSENSMDKCYKPVLSRKIEILKKDMIARATKKFKHRKNKIPKYLELHSVANFRFARRLGVNAKLSPHVKIVRI
ncbi:hypothetical protein TNCT_447281 [Trichonephila clavata]|uniref:Uncharacterized protein n=1 Tax=Trichonephila clavata TaxID=2740835 RepID=A0A8X6KF37_TRICU|nr:hypothetical protein TNCT_447281 [Trichonephila clavata]